MRICLLFLIMIFSACNDQKISDEQRRAVQKEMAQSKPVRISEEQILTKAFEEARNDLKDTTVTIYNFKKFYVKPADSILVELWQAYQYAAAQKVAATDNIQLYDSVVIYSKPTIENDSLQSMLIAVIPKKDIVLKLTDQ